VIHVVIVNFNAGRMLADAVASVIDAVDGVVVVDNASRDGSIELLERQFAGRPSLTVVRRADNGGFAVGCNDGLRAIGWIGQGYDVPAAIDSKGPSDVVAPSAQADQRPNGPGEDLVLFLNPDARCLPGTVETLRRTIRSDARVGAVGGLLVDDKGVEQRGSRRDAPTPWRGFVRAFGLWPLGRWWPRLFPDFHLERRPLGTVPFAVDAVSGACIMVRRSAIDEVGPFDERYFLHCEDLDLCMRLNRAGWLVWCVPTARVWHALRATTRGRSLHTEWHKHRGMVRFYRTHFGPMHPEPLLWLVFLAVWARFTVAVLWISLRRGVGKALGRG
jgi:GT2 family glycosyltransferase